VNCFQSSIFTDDLQLENRKVKGTSEEARTINSHLDYLKNQVLEAEKKLFKKDISITLENLKNELTIRCIRNQKNICSHLP